MVSWYALTLPHKTMVTAAIVSIRPATTLGYKVR